MCVAMGISTIQFNLMTHFLNMYYTQIYLGSQLFIVVNHGHRAIYSVYHVSFPQRLVLF